MVLNAKFGCLVSNCFFVFLASSWSRGQTQPKLDWIEGFETRNIVLVNFSKWHHTNSKELTTSTAAPEWIYWWWPSTWQRAPFRVLGSRTLKTFKLRMKGDERILIRILFFYEKLPNTLELEGFFGSGKVSFDLIWSFSGLIVPPTSHVWSPTGPGSDRVWLCIRAWARSWSWACSRDLGSNLGEPSVFEEEGDRRVFLDWMA